MIRETMGKPLVGKWGVSGKSLPFIGAKFEPAFQAFKICARDDAPNAGSEYDGGDLGALYDRYCPRRA
jgi:hypothetical protein